MRIRSFLSTWTGNGLEVMSEKLSQERDEPRRVGARGARLMPELSALLDRQSLPIAQVELDPNNIQLVAHFTWNEPQGVAVVGHDRRHGDADESHDAVLGRPFRIGERFDNIATATARAGKYRVPSS